MTARLTATCLVMFCAGLLLGFVLGVPSGRVPVDWVERARPAALSARALRVTERRPLLPVLPVGAASALQAPAGSAGRSQQGGSDLLALGELQARLADVTERLERAELRLSDYRRKAYADLRVSVSAWLERDFAADVFVQDRGESRIEVTEQVEHVLLDLAFFAGTDQMAVLRERVSRGTVVELARFLSHWQGQSEVTGQWNYGVRSREIEAILGVPIYTGSS